MSRPVPKPTDIDPETLAEAARLVTAAEFLEKQRLESVENAARQIELEAAILDELRRMNRLLYGITYGPKRFTLSFFSGITRGLGAVLGATVVFALFVGALSYLDTTPIIGNYVKQILQIAQPGGHAQQSKEASKDASAEPAKAPAPEPAFPTPAPADGDAAP